MVGGTDLEGEDQAGATETSQKSRTLGNYRLLRPIGRGRTAEVYLAEHAEDKTQVAVKVLLLHLTGRERRAFLDKMQTVAALKHPHLVRVLEFDVAGDVPYIVMSYAPHGTLSHILPGGQPVAPEKILPYIEQIADALHYAHEHHLLHLDLQPGNLLLGSSYEVWLSDIAITRLVQGVRSSSSLDVVGNVLYLAPEQLKGKGSSASDQYALGIITYEWLCGHHPFEGTFIEVGKQHLHSPVPSLRASVPTLPAGIEQVVLRALAKDPARRFENVKAFAHAFEEACRPQTFPPFSLSNVLTLIASESQLSPPAPASTGNSLSENTLSTEADPSLPETSASEDDTLLVEVSLPAEADEPLPEASASEANTLPVEASLPIETDALIAEISPSPEAEAQQSKESFPAEADAQQPEESSSAEADTLMLDVAPPAASDASLPGAASFTGDDVSMQDTSFPVKAAVSSPGIALAVEAAFPTEEPEEALAATELAELPTSTALEVYKQPSSPGWQWTDADAAPASALPTQPQPLRLTPTLPFTPFPETPGPIEPAQLDAAWTPMPGAAAPGPAVRERKIVTQRPAERLVARPGGTKLLARPTTAYVNTRLPPRPDMYVQRFSRRTVIAGIAGLIGVAAIGGGATWYLLQPHSVTLGTTLYTYVRHGNQVLTAAWSPAVKTATGAASTTPRIASGSLDHTVQVWDALTGNHGFTYSGHTGAVEVVAWSPNGRYIASGGVDQQIHVWDAVTGHRLLTYQGHSDGVLSLSWSPDGKYIASAGKDATVQVWDAKKGHRLLTYRGHKDWVGSVAWSPNGKYMASASADKTVQVWDASKGHHILSYKGHMDKVWAVAWASDSQRLASGGDDHTVQVWQATTGYSIYTYRGHNNPVEAVAWSPDGQHIASGGEDKTVQVWHPSIDENAFTYANHYGTVWSVAWSPDGQCIASGSLDHTVQVWQAV